MTEVANDIDNLLEQVVLAMASGDNTTAVQLLPKIMLSGNEIQRQMAESFQTQLDVLIAMEQEADELTELIGEVAAPVNVTSEVAKDQLVSHEISSDDAVTGDARKTIEYAQVAETTAMPVQTKDYTDIAESAVQKSIDDDRNAKPKPNVMPEPVEVCQVTHLHENVLGDLASENKIIPPQPSTDATLSDQEREMNMALEQVSVLLADGEYETAEMLLPFVFEHGDASYCQKAEFYAKQIEQAKQSFSSVSSLEKQQYSENDVVDDAQAVESSENQDPFASDTIVNSLESQLKTTAVHDSSMLTDNDNLSAVFVDSPRSIENKTPPLDRISGDSRISESPVSADNRESPKSSADSVKAIENGTTVPNAAFGDSMVHDVFEPSVSSNKERLSALFSKDVGVTEHKTIAFDDSIVHKPSVANDTNRLSALFTEHVAKTVDNEAIALADASESVHLKNESEHFDNAAVDTLLSPVHALAPDDIADLESSADSSDSVHLKNESEHFDNDVVDTLLAPVHALASADVADLESSSQTQSKVDETQIQRQGFFVGDVGLMIDFADGSELTEMPPYFRVPNSPSWLIGLTNMHSNVIPIFDLAVFLNLDAAEKRSDKQMMLVIAHDEKAIGVVIHSLPTRLTLDTSHQASLNTAPIVLREYIRTVCYIEDKLWFDLNIISLCDKLEQRLSL